MISEPRNNRTSSAEGDECDATCILTPHYNHAVPPSQDVFSTGLLTPQASQNTVDSDVAKSLISPDPEDSAPAGTSRQSVRFNLRYAILLSLTTDL